MSCKQQKPRKKSKNNVRSSFQCHMIKNSNVQAGTALNKKHLNADDATLGVAYNAYNHCQLF